MTAAKPPFETVVAAHLPVLYRVARRLCGGDVDAEDAVGDTLLKAVRAYAAFDGRFPRAWLIQILRNEHLGALRRRAVRPESQIDEAIEPSDEGFWRRIEWRAVGEDLLRELDGLPEEYRLAVVLCDVEEMTYEEAATACGVPTGTVRSRLFRGRRLLRARLVGAYGEEITR